MIGITGASGQIGRRVAGLLSERHLSLRLIARHPDRLPVIPGAEQSGPTDYSDRDSLRSALAGLDVLFLVSAMEDPQRVQQHRNVIDVAASEGVSHVVYLSFQGVAPDCTFTFGRDHFHTEESITSSRLGYTFLRDSLYMAGLVGMTGDDHVLRGPAGNGKVAAVAHEDVAAVAAAVLTDPAAHDKIGFDVTGPTAISLADVAATLTELCGRPVRYQPETEDEAYASRSAYGAADWEVAGWVTSYQAIAHGEVSAVSDAVTRLSGHQPVDFATYCRQHPKLWSRLC